MQLTIENKELKKKKEAWNDIDYAYKKALKSISKFEHLEGQKELWLQEHKIRNQNHGEDDDTNFVDEEHDCKR